MLLKITCKFLHLSLQTLVVIVRSTLEIAKMNGPLLELLLKQGLGHIVDEVQDLVLAIEVQDGVKGIV